MLLEHVRSIEGLAAEPTSECLYAGMDEFMTLLHLAVAEAFMTVSTLEGLCGT